MCLEFPEDLDLARAKSRSNFLLYNLPWQACQTEQALQKSSASTGLLDPAHKIALHPELLVRIEQGSAQELKDCSQPLHSVQLSARKPGPESFLASPSEADGAVFQWEPLADQNPTCSGKGCASLDRFASSWHRTRS